MRGYVLIDRYPPLLLARRVGYADRAAVAEMLGRVTSHLESSGGRKVALVYDAGDLAEGRPDAQARQYGGEWLRAEAALLKRAVSGIDFAIPSALSRGALTAVFWISHPPVPFRLHASSREAIDGAIAHSGAHGLDAGDVLAALRARG